MFKTLKQLFCKHQFKKVRDINLGPDYLEVDDTLPRILNFEPYLEEQTCKKCGKTQHTEKFRPS